MNSSATTACLLCGGETTHKMTMPIDAKTFKGTSFGRVYECAKCLVGFIHPRPTPQDTNAFYEVDAYYTQGKSHMLPARSRFWSKVRMHLAWRRDRGAVLADVISASLPPGASVVDIGCGEGHLIRNLHSRGYQVTGVERDPSAVSIRDRSIRVLRGSVEALPSEIAPGSVDGVVFSHVMEHLIDPISAMRSAVRLLKPDGLLFCEVPNNESEIARQSGLSWEHLDIPRHINFFTERSLVALAKLAGLASQRVYFAGYCRYFSDSYIATEQRIHDQLAALPHPPSDSTRNSTVRAWALLTKTAFATPQRKYDSVGIVARRA